MAGEIAFAALPSVRVYVINLESATKRWLHIQSTFAELEIPFTRVSAVDGKTLRLKPYQTQLKKQPVPKPEA